MRGFNFKRIFAFNLMEIMISLIAISCIAVAFTPVVTKQIQKSFLSKIDSVAFVKDCEQYFCPECKACKPGNPPKCLVCNKQCPEDHYLDNDNCQCVSCREKFPKNDKKCIRCTDKICTRCEAGYYLRNGECVICPEGTFCSEGDVKPNPCKEYQWTAEKRYSGIRHLFARGKTRCTWGCPEGKYCHNPKKDNEDPDPQLDDCPKGHYCNYGNVKKPCPAGTYRDVEGLERNATRSLCKYCDPGWWTCGPNIDARDSSCIAKISGPRYINKNSKQNGCGHKCQAGYYCHTAKKTICPKGHRCPEGSGDPTPCDAGTYQDQEGQAVCKACPAGTYSTGKGAITCLKCQPGTYQPEEGKTGCKDTTCGHYQNEEGQSYQKECQPGYYQSGTHQIKCDPASCGHYVKDKAQCKQIACDAGRYQSKTAATSCTDKCTGASFSGKGACKCTPCNKGTAGADGYANKCPDCPLGYYQDVTGQGTCKKCPAGQYQDEVGKSKCKCCGAGLWSEEGRTTACTTKCPAGKCCNNCKQGTCKKGYKCPEGSSICDDEKNKCSCGTYSREGASVCTKCGPGWYQNAAGQGECKKTPCGNKTDKEGMCSYTQCPAGTWAPENSSVCSNCAAGKWGAAGRCSACTDDCPGGKCCPGNGTIGTCRAGYYCPKGSGSCEENECGCGTYSRAGASDCTRCSKGYYQSGKTATRCEPCPAGQYSDTTGSCECTCCSAGTYQGRTGRSSCSECSNGRYSTECRSACSDCTRIDHCRTYSRTDCSCRECRSRYKLSSGSCVPEFTCPSGGVQWNRRCYWWPTTYAGGCYGAWWCTWDGAWSTCHGLTTGGRSWRMVNETEARHIVDNASTYQLRSAWLNCTNTNAYQNHCYWGYVWNNGQKGKFCWYESNCSPKTNCTGPDQTGGWARVPYCVTDAE